MTKVMKKIIITIMSVVLLLACGNNKTRQTESVIYAGQSNSDLSEPDTITSSVQEEMLEV